MKNISQEQKKKLAIIGVGILGFALVFLVSFILFKNVEHKSETPKDKIEANTNENIIKDQEVDGFKFSNTALVIENGESTLTTEVKNTTGKDIELKSFDIVVTGKDGETIVTLLGYVGEIIKAGETKSIISSTDHNLKSAVSIEYKINY